MLHGDLNRSSGPRHKPQRGWAAGLAALAASALLAACGGTAGGSSSGTGSGSGTGTGTGSTATYAIAVNLVDANNNSITQLAPGATATAVATLTATGTGAVLANQIVTFSTGSSALVNLSPASGTALTNASGVATVVLTAGSSTAGGALSLLAAASIGSQSPQAQVNFSVGQSVGTGLALASITAGVGTGALSSYGTTSIVATVTNNGAVPTAPVTVNFTTSCAPGKASIAPSVTTLPDGTAHASFADNGCAPLVLTQATVSAAISGSAKAVNFNISPPSSGSIKFTASNPSAGTSITLKGQGGAGRQEYATLTFTLVDVAGNGVPNFPVCFDATTYVGGLTIDGFNNQALPSGGQKGTAAQCGTDNTLFYLKPTLADGTVTVQVNSGSAPTPVTVRARAAYPAGSATLLQTLSDQLSISTGLPINHNMSFAVDAANIDGGEHDGIQAKLTIRLADLFGNPVTDNTQVNMVTSGGAVCSSLVGACSTANGACTCTLNSQAQRPADGRVVVLAYTTGLPDFTDTNANFVFDANIDFFTPLGDPYLDAIKNGVYTAVTTNGDTDRCFPYNNGAACNTGPFAQVQTGYGPTYISRLGVVYFSLSSSPTIIIPSSEQATATSTSSQVGKPVVPYPTTYNAAAAPTACANTLNFWGLLTDGNGNPMAAGTTIAIGTVSNTLNPTVSPPFPLAVAALGLRPPIAAVDFPNVPKTTVSNISAVNTQIIGSAVNFTLNTGTTSGYPADCSGDFNFSVLVKSPNGAQVPAKIVFEGENPANVTRYTVPVHYQ